MNMDPSHPFNPMLQQQYGYMNASPVDPIRNPIYNNQYFGAYPHQYYNQPPVFQQLTRPNVIRSSTDLIQSGASYPAQQFYPSYVNHQNPQTGCPVYFNQPMPNYSVPNSSMNVGSNPPTHPSNGEQTAQQPPAPRTKNPIRIVDPDSKKEIQISNTDNQASKLPNENNLQNTSSSNRSTNKKDTDRVEKDQKSVVNEFRQKVIESMNADNQASKKDQLTTINKPESVPEEKKVVDAAQPVVSNDSPVPTTVQNEAPSKQLETPTDSKPETNGQNETKITVEIAEVPVKTEAPKTAQRSSASKRASYTIEELLKIRDDPKSSSRPENLKQIEGVTLKRSMTGGPSFSSTRPSLTLAQPALPNRASNPYMVVSRSQISEDGKFVRTVKSIMNKLTPENYDSLVKQLDELDLNSEQRLDEMITIIFGKAVEEPSFCSLYATMCKQFQKKQVTVPDATGKVTTHIYRQKLLARCQKEFENDYRQEIQYEKRKQEVDSIADEKERKEMTDALEEELGKAKRKKLGNIFFIGELFKLQMLTENIMLQCLEMLLSDRRDEESLECLCRLLTTIGKELDAKATSSSSTSNNRKIWDRTYVDLQGIIDDKTVSARISFMILDLLDLRKAKWVTRRAEVKPVKIDEIHQAARLQREQNDAQIERDRQKRDSNRSSNPPNYSGNRGSGLKQQNNRNDDERDNHFNVANLRQLHSNDKKNQGQPPFTFAPQCAWNKGSNTANKPSSTTSATPSTITPIVGHNSKSKVSIFSGNSASREKNQRPEDSSNLNRQASRQNSKDANQPPSQSVKTVEKDSPVNEEQTINRVKSLTEEYTENYSDNSERPVKEALDDLSDFKTSKIDQHVIIVRELFFNVIEAKTRARKAVGHLLAAALQNEVLTEESIVKGFQAVSEMASDFEVDIPLIWTYIGEIVGAFVGASKLAMSLLKKIISIVPGTKSAQFFRDLIKAAVEFKSKSHILSVWQSAGLSLNDLLNDSQMSTLQSDQYEWLEKKVACAAADPGLVRLFETLQADAEQPVLDYIQTNIKKDKFYIRNIILSFLESCPGNSSDACSSLMEKRDESWPILQKIINEQLENEIQAIYAIQNYVHALQHPNKLARLLFDLFYDKEIISENAFLQWRDSNDQTENEGHSVVVISTKGFFEWLETADPEDDGDNRKQ